MTARPTPGGTRREGVDALTVRLRDGQDWGFSLPTARLKPRFVTTVDEFGRSAESVTAVSNIGHPIEIERLITGLREATVSGTVGDQHAAFFALAAALLLRAHDLTDNEARDLLAVDARETPRLVRDVVSAATGQLSRSFVVSKYD